MSGCCMGITAHGTVPVPAPTQEPQHDDGWKGSSGTDDGYTNSSPGALSTPQKGHFSRIIDVLGQSGMCLWIHGIGESAVIDV